MSKEPGQMAYEATPTAMTWEQQPDSAKALWAITESTIRTDEAAKVRAATIEECAKVAESLIVEPTATRDVNVMCQELAAAEMGASIATAIRALEGGA